MNENDFSVEDLRDIKEFAMNKFLNSNVNNKNDRYFLTECFIHGIMCFLSKNKFKIVKIEENNVQE